MAQKMLVTLGLAVLMLSAVAWAGKNRSTASKAAATPAKPTSAPTAIQGTIVRVDGKNVIVKTPAGEKTVLTDDATVVTINKITSGVGDLKPGQVVKITPVTGTAQQIDATRSSTVVTLPNPYDKPHRGK